MVRSYLAYVFFYSASLTQLFFINFIRFANLNSFLRECLKIFRHLSQASKKNCRPLNSSRSTCPGLVRRQVQSSMWLPFTQMFITSSLIQKFSSAFSALTLFRVSTDMTSMFVSEVARALKLMLEFVIRECQPRIEPEILILSSTKSSS